MKTLIVVGLNDERVREIDARTRGVHVVPVDDVSFRQPRADTAFLILAPMPGLDSLETLANVGVPILITLDASLSPARLASLGSLPNIVFANFEPWLPSRRLLREQLEAGKLGVPGLVRLHRWWKATANAPNGSLLRDLGQILDLFGRLPTEIFATGKANLQVHLGFSNGGMATLDLVRTLPEDEHYFAMHLIGSSGAAYVEDANNAQLEFVVGQPAFRIAEETLVGQACLVQAFADHVTEKRPFPSENWADLFAVQDAIQTSLEQRQAVSFSRVH